MADKIPSKINLEIVTPERQFFCGEVDVVYIPGREGYMGILPGHAPLLSELKTGIISYSSDGVEKRLFCGWGFAEVLGDQVSILAEKAELPEEIDAAQAKADKEEADTLLRSKSLDTDFQGALELWQASVARLEALSTQRP
jgi:F-type H+-transporting ATPase subunit epsilon